MQLFLSSYRAGNFESELLKLLGNINRFAFISNAKDYKSVAERNKSLKENFAYYHSIGLQAVEVDLRPYFHKPAADKLLDDFGYVFLAGGNTFLLRRALSYAGVDEYLKQRIRQNSLIYGGESAGTIMAGPTLRGSENKSTPEHEDDAEFVPESYEAEILWDGLGITDFVLIPHYQSTNDHQRYLEEHKIAYKTIREEEVFIMDGERAELLR